MSGFYIFLTLIVIICFLLILVVMVQNPKGGGISSTAFGGGSSQIVGGVKKTTDFLDRSTWTLAGLLFLLVLLSNYTLRDRFSTADSRVINGAVEVDDFQDQPASPEESGIFEEEDTPAPAPAGGDQPPSEQ